MIAERGWHEARHDKLLVVMVVVMVVLLAAGVAYSVRVDDIAL